MKSLVEGLPPEIAQRIHPDWKKNEADYWMHRDELLARYRDQWIGFANGRVIVSGTSPVEVFHAAQASGQHPFITCVTVSDLPKLRYKGTLQSCRTIPASMPPDCSIT